MNKMMVSSSTKGLGKNFEKYDKTQQLQKITTTMDRVEQLKTEILKPINQARGEFETFHERLKDLRENRIENRIGYRLKQNEAAFLTDQLAPNYNRVERGLIKPSIDLLIQLSEIFGVTIDFLVKGNQASKLYITGTGDKEEGKETQQTSSGGILEAYQQVISAKDNQIDALNSLIEQLHKENQRLSKDK